MVLLLRRLLMMIYCPQCGMPFLADTCAKEDDCFFIPIHKLASDIKNNEVSSSGNCKGSGNVVYEESS